MASEPNSYTLNPTTSISLNLNILQINDTHKTTQHISLSSKMNSGTLKKLQEPTYFPMYSPWSTVSQLWHLKHHTCHCRSSATRAWPSLNWFPQPAQAPGSEGPSTDPLVTALFPTGVEASRTGIPTHRWQRAWPIGNPRLVEIGQIRSTIRVF